MHLVKAVLRLNGRIENARKKRAIRLHNAYKNDVNVLKSSYAECILLEDINIRR